MSPRWVVLCGAGVSVAPPSSVPSWWGFNQAVLEELRRRFLAEHPAPARTARALELLSLDRVEVAEFSQIVSNAFAGQTWFEPLIALDGSAPNSNHRLLARWAASGGLAAVVTTNFDTLVERALRDIGVSYVVLDAQLDAPPVAGTDLAVVKLHGTAARRASLVDTANQKRRGLPPAWLDWLEETFAAHPVAVAGFSGADLALGEDYLRLRASSDRTPQLLWLHRPGQTPPQEAREVVELGGGRSAFVVGDLPAAWPEVGAPFAADRRIADTPLMDDATVDVSAAIAQWLEHPMVDADTCGLALCRLLDAAGSHTAAQSLRTSILTRVRRQLRGGVDLSALARTALQIGQLAGDEPLTRAPAAIYCLGLALRALDAVVEQLDPSVREQDDVQDELAHNRATILSNIAYFEVCRGRGAEATEAIEIARNHAARLGGVRRLNHDAAYLEIHGALAFLAGHRDWAREAWTAARDLSLQSGNARRVATTTENLAR